jgi:hypothetical protein
MALSTLEALLHGLEVAHDVNTHDHWKVRTHLCEEILKHLRTHPKEVPNWQAFPKAQDYFSQYEKGKTTQY